MNNLKELFDESTKIISEKITVDYLYNLVKLYNGNDWIDHIIYLNDLTKYHKKLIFVNELIELYIITWNVNSFSPIHDHPNNGCILKILSGKLDEYIYENINGLTKFISEKNISTGEIGYRYGKQFIHKIINSNNDITVSLHIYSKPNYKANIYLNSDFVF